MLFIYGEACAVLLPMERGMRMDVFWCLDYNLIKRGLEKEGASVMSSYTGRKLNALLCALLYHCRRGWKKQRCYKSMVLMHWLLL